VPPQLVQQPLQQMGGPPDWESGLHHWPTAQQPLLQQSWLTQTFPQPLQLFPSLVRLTHLPLQQVSPDVHLLPQAPQLFGSLPVSVHVPLQQLSVPGQSPVVAPQVHDPLTQLSPGEQTLPQAPQLLGLLTSVQKPLQQATPLAEQQVWAPAASRQH